METAKHWIRVEVRPGEKGPLVVEAVKVRAQTKRGRRNGPEEVMVIFRERQGRKTVKHDYALSNAPFGTSLREFARVLSAEHRVEECLRRAKGESGLAQYQVRTWRGWHHHQTLTLIATWFLTQEKRRGEKGVAVSLASGGTLHHRPTAA
jgi:SRSO17 transposase